MPWALEGGSGCWAEKCLDLQGQEALRPEVFLHTWAGDDLPGWELGPSSANPELGREKGPGSSFALALSIEVLGALTRESGKQWAVWLSTSPFTSLDPGMVEADGRFLGSGGSGSPSLRDFLVASR